LKPDDPSLYAERGFARLKKEDRNGAVEDFSKAIELKPDDSSYYEARLYLYTDEKDAAKALGDLTHLIALKPEETDLYMRRSDLYLKLNKYDEALADYEKILAKDPKNIQALAGKGEVIAMKGDRKSGAAQLQEALRMATDPKEKEGIQAKLRAIGVGPL
jgi:tetratricopeptide (TPR) repeat protein